MGTEMSLSERDALELLRTATVAGVASDLPDLTARQTAILMTVAMEAGPHTVRGLAAGLDLSKPVVTRALDRLSSLSLVRRIADESDLRSVFIERTPQATAFLRALAAPLTGAAPTRKTPAKNRRAA